VYPRSFPWPNPVTPQEHNDTHTPSAYRDLGAHPSLDRL
jgi:hypothetical protein